MPVHLEITDAEGFRSTTVDDPRFWIGCDADCTVPIAIPGCASRVLEVQAQPAGGLVVRAESSLPFPVRSSTGDVGDRFDVLLDGDVLNVGPALVKMRVLQAGEGAGDAAEEIDLGAVQDDDPGMPIGAWYATFMAFADHLEALSDPQSMVDAALSAVVNGTSAERAHLSLEREVIDRDGTGRSGHFLTEGGDRTPFVVSSSLIERVRDGGRAVHVPVASADPVASQFASIRREGISSGIALPIQALGRRAGVLYADCVREGRVLSARDLQRVVFIARLLASALGNRNLVAELVRVGPGHSGAAVHPALESSSPACAEMVERATLYAPTDYTVLLRGETGTGKEVLARAIHDLSRRKEGPFVPVNCAAIPEQLMESMLFGHEKGAFTGATESRSGHFEEAHGGTLFLDEIGDMPVDLQAKILRALQDRVVMPLGSRRQVKVDVRIVAATHQDLERMIDERAFREDLYFRLNELEITLPPLRHRLDDLSMLCSRFLAEAARELGLDAVQDLTRDAMDALRERDWRGNIRELRHVVKGAALRARGGAIRREHLGDPLPQRRTSSSDAAAGPTTGTWKERLDQQEAMALQETLDRAGGNLTKGAELFGVPRTTYREKLLRHGLLSRD